jgi:hypothetical protein
MPNYNNFILRLTMNWFEQFSILILPKILIIYVESLDFFDVLLTVYHYVSL